MVLVVVSIVYIATGATCVIIVHLYDSIVRVLVFTLAAGGGGCPDCPSAINQCIVGGQDSFFIVVIALLITSSNERWLCRSRVGVATWLTTRTNMTTPRRLACSAPGGVRPLPPCLSLSASAPFSKLRLQAAHPLLSPRPLRLLIPCVAFRWDDTVRRMRYFVDLSFNVDKSFAAKGLLEFFAITLNLLVRSHECVDVPCGWNPTGRLKFRPGTVGLSLNVDESPNRCWPPLSITLCVCRLCT